MLVNELTNSHILDVSLGKSHSLAVCSKGKVYAWGKVGEGALEQVSDMKCIMKPKVVHRVPAS